MFRTLENDPLFSRQPGEDISLEQMRELTFRRCKQLFKYNFLTQDDVMKNPMMLTIFSDCLGMYDWSLGAKYNLNKGVSLFHCNHPFFDPVTFIFFYKSPPKHLPVFSDSSLFLLTLDRCLEPQWQTQDLRDT